MLAFLPGYFSVIYTSAIHVPENSLTLSMKSQIQVAESKRKEIYVPFVWRVLNSGELARCSWPIFSFSFLNFVLLVSSIPIFFFLF